MGRKIFVVGTGRSGTHWLSRTLEAHPRIRVTTESPAIFNRVTQAALDPSLRRRYWPGLVGLYNLEHLRSGSRHYVDKSHPNLWHAEGLARTFPRARFVGVRRSVEGTVASMLDHEGVLRWQRQWREYPVPNAFLGITVELAAVYDELPLAAQCALRWKSHTRRLDEVARVLGGRFLLLDFEALFDDYEGEARRLWEFLEVRPIDAPVRPNGSSRDKWRSRLTDQDLQAIRDVCGTAE